VIASAKDLWILAFVQPTRRAEFAERLANSRVKVLFVGDSAEAVSAIGEEDVSKSHFFPERLAHSERTGSAHQDKELRCLQPLRYC
jgi:hypothetical protein